MPGTYQYDVEIKSNVAKLLSDMKQVQDRLDTVDGKEYKIKLNVDEKKLSSVISNLEKMLDSLGKGTGDFKQFENLSKELSSVVSEVQSLSKAFGKVDDSGAKTLLSSIQNIDKSLAELSRNILNVNKNMSNMGGNTGGAVKQVENIRNAYQDAAKEAEKLADAQSKIGQKTNISSGMKDTFPKTSENLEQVAQSEQKIQQEARAIQSKWEQAEKAIQNYMNAVTKLNNLMYVGFYGMVNAVKKSISTITELDTALVDLKKTTVMNENQLENFYYDSNNVAKQMGVTTKEIIDQASAWSRLGYSTAEAATTMAKLSSQFASISPGMSVDESQSGLVSIMKAWSIDPDQVKSEIMDPINKLGNTMALSNQDIVEGMERSAAALAAVGTSVQDGLAMFSGIQEVLQNAEKSGTALRSVALRVRSFDESTEEYSEDLANITGELIDLTKTAEHAQGISIFKEGSTTEFKDLTDYFGEIADIWDEMSQKQQNDFLLKAFGRTQAQAGAALIQNYKGVTKALDEMEQSAGSSDKEMETIEQSLEYRINALKETWVGAIQQMVDRGDLGTIVDGLTKLSEGIGFVTSNLGLLKTAALGITGVLAFKNVGRDKMYSLSF